MRNTVQLKAFDIPALARHPQPESWIKKALVKRSTYKRKYYLHRRVKQSGFSLKLDRFEKTINVKQDQTDKARDNKYVTELQKSFGYGVQILNINQ